MILPSLGVRESEQGNTGHWNPTTNSLSVPCPEMRENCHSFSKKDCSGKKLCCAGITLTLLAHQSWVKSLKTEKDLNSYKVKTIHLWCPVLDASIAPDSRRQIPCHFRYHAFFLSLRYLISVLKIINYLEKLS